MNKSKCEWYVYYLIKVAALCGLFKFFFFNFCFIGFLIWKAWNILFWYSVICSRLWKKKTKISVCECINYVRKFKRWINKRKTSIAFPITERLFFCCCFAHAIDSIFSLKNYMSLWTTAQWNGFILEFFSCLMKVNIDKI